MTDKPENYRMERIERLFNELRYELERGFMDREIDETISYRFMYPISQSIPGGIIFCKFETKPMTSGIAAILGEDKPKLELVKK